jgi:tetratricopeptide (TPR) repeat protein
MRAADAHAAGVQLYNRGQPARAMTTLRRAQQALASDRETPERDRQVLAARIWISIALNASELRSVDAGFEALAEAQSIADQVGDPALDVLLHSQRGLIELRGGSLPRSRHSLDAAVNLLEHAAARDQANILMTRGTVGLAEGRLVDARRDFERGARIADAARLGLEKFKILHNLAYVQFLLGELATALRLMSEAERIDLGEDWGIVLLDRARILSEAGLVRNADEALARASAIFRRYRVAQDLAETELERARCALALGDVRAARRFAASARDRFRRRGSDRWRRSAELVLLQADVADGRPGTRLEPHAQRLARDFESEGLRLHATMARLIAAEALLAAGRVDAASSLAEVGPARHDDPITGRMYGHYVRAKVDAARGAAAAASRRARRALDELARYQASFGSIDLRTASAVHGRRLAELDIVLALEGRSAASVFAAAERARAVSARLPAVRPPDDPVAAELLAELRQIVESLRVVEQDKAASEPLLRRRRELERHIVARSWTISGSGSVTRPASLDAVRGGLADHDRTMITYVQAGDNLSAVVVGRRVRVHDLGASAPVIEHVRRARADLDVLAHPRLPRGIRSAVRGSLNRSLHELEAALLAPLDADGPLVLVSTGVLGQLPWASLPSLLGRSLVVAPSATKWLASTRVERVGDVSVHTLAGPDLERGDAEAAAVGGVWPGARVVRGATPAAFIEATKSATVLHVAAHGVHEPANPLFSFVRMVDGPVFAHELDQHGHAPEHVVLSACEVGLATIRPGDEALGLASVLLHLGTRSVIAGVARVGDEVAEQTMSAYHAKLASGLDSASALAAAIAEVDADVPPPFVNFGAAWARNLEAGSPLA